MKRRAFLAGSAAGLGLLGGAPPESRGASAEDSRGEAAGGDGYQAPEWLRCARAVYFDGYVPPIFPHLDEFDAKRLVDAVVDLGADTLRFQPIGYRASYQSKVYPIHPELGARDLVEEVSRECRKAGLHLYCYCPLTNEVDAASISDERYSGWARRGPDGKPEVEQSLGDGFGAAICAAGDAYRRAIRETVRELCRYDIDGLYFDAPSGYRGICYCQDCRTKFRAFSGMDIERLRGFRNLRSISPATDMEALRVWWDWANKLTEEDLRDLRKIIHDSRKFMLCHNGGTWWPGSYHLQYRFADGFMLEHHEQVYLRLFSGLMGASTARPAKRLAQVYMGGYDVSNISHPAHVRPWSPHFLNMEDGDEVRMEGFANLASGNVPIYAVANRLLFGLGSGSADRAKEVFALMRRAEPLVKDTVPVPYVSVVLTAESAETWRSRRVSWNKQMSESFGLAMLDGRISLDVCPNTEMSEEWLERQRVVALCGATAIRDDDARRLTEWVRRGGGLLATYDTGLCDENGALRKDGGALKDVLGVEMKGEPLQGLGDCYFRMSRSHPALGEFREGSRIMGDGRLLPVEVRPGATLLADCWYMGGRKSRGPAIVANEFGRGRALYIAGSLEAHYATSRVRSLERILASVVQYLARNHPLPFDLEAPRGVYGLLRRATTGDLVLWICANVGFKDAAAGRMRQEYMAVSNVEAKVRIPGGREVKAVHLLRAGARASFTMSGEYAVVTIPSVHIAEIVHVELG